MQVRSLAESIQTLGLGTWRLKGRIGGPFEMLAAVLEATWRQCFELGLALHDLPEVSPCAVLTRRNFADASEPFSLLCIASHLGRLALCYDVSGFTSSRVQAVLGQSIPNSALSVELRQHCAAAAL